MSRRTCDVTFLVSILRHARPFLSTPASGPVALRAVLAPACGRPRGPPEAERSCTTVARMRRIVAGLLGALAALGVASCGGAPVPTAQVGALKGKTPSDIVSVAKAAAEASGSAHYVLTATSAGQTQTIEGDVSKSSARQSITQGSHHIEVVLVHDTAYVSGDSGGLSTAMGLKTSVADRYAGMWIAVHSSDSLYASITSAVTLDNILAELVPSGTLSLTAPRTVGGRQVIGVHGGLPGPSQSGVTGSTTLFVATNRPTLPISVSGTATMGKQHVTDTGSVTKWGVAVHLAAPSGSVAFSSLPTS